jgi:hypothetical protein
MMRNKQYGFFVKYLCEIQTEKRADTSPVLEFITSVGARNKVGIGMSYPQVCPIRKCCHVRTRAHGHIYKFNAS